VANAVYVIVGSGDPSVEKLKRKKIVSTYTEGVFEIVARYGVNKSTLKKIFKKETEK